jgi:hypothetical protein
MSGNGFHFVVSFELNHSQPPISGHKRSPETHLGLRSIEALAAAERTSPWEHNPDTTGPCQQWDDKNGEFHRKNATIHRCNGFSGNSWDI